MPTKLQKVNSRKIAAEIIFRLVENKTTLAQFDKLVEPYQLSNADRSFIWRVCFDTAKYYHYYLSILPRYIDAKKTKAMIKVLIIIGFVQLEHTNQPDYAVISETVNAAHTLKLSWAKKLINAVLRKHQRNLLENKTQSTQVELLSLPYWLKESLKSDYNNQASYIANLLLNDANVYLRINQTKISKNTYISYLENEGINYTDIDLIPNCICINQSIKIHSLPFYSEGYFSVQDLSAQYASHLVSIKPNSNVLDACAAPGGKSLHLLESFKNINLVTLDNDAKRLTRLEENLSRLQLNPKAIKIICADATQTDTWWNNQLFDTILLDAPCSATGVIRRHPDIKLVRTETDISITCSLQAKLLNKLWPLLKPGGQLLYMTCSLLKRENDDQIKQFLESKNGNSAIVNDISVNLPGQKTTYGYQVFPKISDGFYYALLTKKFNQ
ncbi:16S rRNA (cytosine(967)-C(5))-methyltransferase RsmB [Thiotrichales bacterium 19S3-7]|nr:16S rRNA (cytosine(967)-C(5))-methyltransferase RsmB [Thiotrichales bacterium 19S3-7]MCF6802386.1 16S rRNA (cytosine(967)-C(5))-methyltransferase RsmB [Thiotrichales bacterium 19S3-11]